MSLIDDLRAAARVVDPQFQVSTNEVQSVLSALVHYSQYGDEFLHAAEKGIADVGELLGPKPEGDAQPSTAPAQAITTAAPPPGTSAVVGPSATEPLPSAADLEAQISDLQAALAARQATEQQTQVTHETGPGPTEPAPPVAPAPGEGTV